MRFSAFASVPRVALASLLTACSSQALSVTDGGTLDATAGGDSALIQDGSCGALCDAGRDDAHYVVCPSTPPALGSPCSAIGEECEYGSSWWLGCNLVLRCTASGWQQGPEPDCPFPDAGGSCPATFVEANATDAGPFACPAAECQYPDGYCVCMSHCGGGGQWHLDLVGDWYCAQAVPECPSPRPDLGTSCTQPGAGCIYGEMCGCGLQLACVDGVWQGEETAVCP